MSVNPVSIRDWAARVISSEASFSGSGGGLFRGSTLTNMKNKKKCTGLSSIEDVALSLAGETNAFTSEGLAGKVATEYNLSLGDVQMSKINAYLTKLDKKNMFPRSLKQKELHKVFTCAVMHLIYGMEEFKTRYTELKLRMNVADFDRLVACSMPRRFGKTQSVGMHDAVMLLSMMRNFVINVFSTNWRASKLLLNLCYSIIVKLEPECSSMIMVHNVEMLALKDPVTHALKVLNSYPGGV